MWESELSPQHSDGCTNEFWLDFVDHDLSCRRDTLNTPFEAAARYQNVKPPACAAYRRYQQVESSSPLLFILVLSIVTIFLFSGLGLLSPDTAGASSSEWRVESKVDVLLGVKTDDERRDVDNLLADALYWLVTYLVPKQVSLPNVPLLDKHTSMVNRLGQAELVHASLQSSLKEILDLEGKHVIEFHAGLVQHTDTNQTADQGVTLEKALRVLLVEREQLTT
jgi:hypothetical protein